MLKHSPETFRLERDADRRNLLEMAHKLDKQDMTQEIWQTQCEELGIASLEDWAQKKAAQTA